MAKKNIKVRVCCMDGHYWLELYEGYASIKGFSYIEVSQATWERWQRHSLRSRLWNERFIKLAADQYAKDHADEH